MVNYASKIIGASISTVEYLPTLAGSALSARGWKDLTQEKYVEGFLKIITPGFIGGAITAYSARLNPLNHSSVLCDYVWTCDPITFKEAIAYSIPFFAFTGFVGAVLNYYFQDAETTTTKEIKV